MAFRNASYAALKIRTRPRPCSRWEKPREPSPRTDRPRPLGPARLVRSAGSRRAGPRPGHGLDQRRSEARGQESDGGPRWGRTAVVGGGCRRDLGGRGARSPRRPRPHERVRGDPGRGRGPRRHLRPAAARRHGRHAGDRRGDVRCRRPGRGRGRSRDRRRTAARGDRRPGARTGRRLRCRTSGGREPAGQRPVRARTRRATGLLRSRRDGGRGRRAGHHGGDRRRPARRLRRGNPRPGRARRTPGSRAPSGSRRCRLACTTCVSSPRGTSR